MKYSIWIWVIGFLLMGCEAQEPTDLRLARVHNHYLYLSDLEGLFNENTTAEDSSIIIQTFRERWVKETLILHQAEQNKPENLDIETLVKNYRESLLKNSYEQVVVEEELDSVITPEELLAFYEKNKEQYELETPIIRCYFVKVPLPLVAEDSLRFWWNNLNARSIRRLEAYCAQNGGTYILNDSIWTRLEEVAIELPKGSLTANNVGAKRDFQQMGEEYQYFLKVFEVRNRREIAPLSFIEEQARKVILHSRKIKLMQQKKEELYNLELRRNNIEIFEE
jgi:hypothetical protein